MYDSSEGRGGLPATAASDGAPGRTSDVTGWHGCAGRGGAPGIDERRNAGGGVVDGEGNEPPPPPTSTSTVTFRSEGYANRKVHSRKTAWNILIYMYIIYDINNYIQGVINYTARMIERMQIYQKCNFSPANRDSELLWIYITHNMM